MPTSSPDLKEAIFQHIRTVVLEYLPQRYKILDVGPGIGTYGMSLSDLNINIINRKIKIGNYISKKRFSAFSTSTFAHLERNADA